MPRILTLLVVASLLLTACYKAPSAANQPVTVDTTAKLSDGAYLLSSVTVTTPSETSTFNRAQMKIYARQRFAYAFFSQRTNSVDAGAGATEWRDGLLIETPLANHAGAVSGFRFELDVQPNEQGFDQAIDNMRSEDGLSYDLRETWQRISTAASRFDGLWQLQSQQIDGEQRKDAIGEVKMIGGGHYIWFHHYDIDGQQQQHFAYGELEAQPAPAAGVIDTTLQSSYPDHIGQSQALSQSLDAGDRLIETFSRAESTVTKTYVRL